MFASLATAHKTESALMTALGTPEVGDVNASYGSTLTSRVPKYLVAPSSLPLRSREPGGYLVKVVDFGEAHVRGQVRDIHCPLVFRPPEAVLARRWTVQADIWSLGCTVSDPSFHTCLCTCLLSY